MEKYRVLISKQNELIEPDNTFAVKRYFIDNHELKARWDFHLDDEKSIYIFDYFIWNVNDEEKTILIDSSFFCHGALKFIIEHLDKKEIKGFDAENFFYQEDLIVDKKYKVEIQASNHEAKRIGNKPTFKGYFASTFQPEDLNLKDYIEIFEGVKKMREKFMLQDLHVEEVKVKKKAIEEKEVFVPEYMEFNKDFLCWQFVNVFGQKKKIKSNDLRNYGIVRVNNAINKVTIMPELVTSASISKEANWEILQSFNEYIVYGNPNLSAIMFFNTKTKKREYTYLVPRKNRFAIGTIDDFYEYIDQVVQHFITIKDNPKKEVQEENTPFIKFQFQSYDYVLKNNEIKEHILTQEDDLLMNSNWLELGGRVDNKALLQESKLPRYRIQNDLSQDGAAISNMPNFQLAIQLHIIKEGNLKGYYYARTWQLKDDAKPLQVDKPIILKIDEENNQILEILRAKEQTVVGLYSEVEGQRKNYARFLAPFNDIKKQFKAITLEKLNEIYIENKKPFGKKTDTYPLIDKKKDKQEEYAIGKLHMISSPIEWNNGFFEIPEPMNYYVRAEKAKRKPKNELNKINEVNALLKEQRKNFEQQQNRVFREAVIEVE